MLALLLSVKFHFSGGIVSAGLTKVSKFAGRHFSWGRGINRFSTSVAIEEPITPPVQIDHTQLLINGQFVDAASG